MAVARSSSDDNAICYVLPVLWMTSCFHKMRQIQIHVQASVCDVVNYWPWLARWHRGEVCYCRLPCSQLFLWPKWQSGDSHSTLDKQRKQYSLCFRTFYWYKTFTNSVLHNQQCMHVEPLIACNSSALYNPSKVNISLKYLDKYINRTRTLVISVCATDEQHKTLCNSEWHEMTTWNVKNTAAPCTIIMTNQSWTWVRLPWSDPTLKWKSGPDPIWAISARLLVVANSTNFNLATNWT